MSSNSSGDPELATALDALVAPTMRSVAAALIDTAAEPRARLAFVAADGGTRFEIGSVTKGLTGMLLADALQRGDIALDSAVGRVLPEHAGTAFGSITMQELGTHTSGLPRLPLGFLLSPGTFAKLARARDPYRGHTPEQVVNAASRQSLRSRGRPRYSNLGGAVLGQVLARAAGTEFSTLLRDRILRPAGMQGSTVATRHDAAPAGWSTHGRRKHSPWVMDGYAPAGGVVSTLDDMSLLATALLDGSAPGSDAVRALEGVESERPGRASGMFWIVDTRATGATMIWHNGETGGYSAFFALIPAVRRAVVVLANVASAGAVERIALGLLNGAG